MNLLDQTKEICQAYEIWPARSKGQNFLIEESVYDKIIAAANLSKDDTVLEVGPGLGFLTAKLAEKAGRVIAVELDDKLAAYLQDVISESGVENIEIVNANILDFGGKNFPNIKYQISNIKIVANLPYNITSVFLRKFLTSDNKPESMVLMLQKEVAERICAQPGDMSLLALSVQLYAEPEIVAAVPKENFWPMPQVDSAIIKIRTKSKEQRASAAESAGRDSAEVNFFRLAKFGFSAKRKMLKNNLGGGLRIKPSEAEKFLIQAGFNPKARAEDLGVADWMKLAKIIAKK